MFVLTPGGNAFRLFRETTNWYYDHRYSLDCIENYYIIVHNRWMKWDWKMGTMMRKAEPGRQFFAFWSMCWCQWSIALRQSTPELSHYLTWFWCLSSSAEQFLPRFLEQVQSNAACAGSYLKASKVWPLVWDQWHSWNDWVLVRHLSPSNYSTWLSWPTYSMVGLE